MTELIDKAGLRVAAELAQFIDEQALPGTGLDPDRFWTGVASIFARFAPENRALLAIRNTIQAKIDAWHLAPTDSRSTRPNTSRSCAKSAISFPSPRRLR